MMNVGPKNPRFIFVNFKFPVNEWKIKGGVENLLIWLKFSSKHFTSSLSWLHESRVKVSRTNFGWSRFTQV